MNELTNPSFNAMIEECHNLLVEKEFNIRFDIITMYHELGNIILSYIPNKEAKRELCNAIAESLGKSQRTIYYSIAFAKQYPRLDKLPEGKAISWRKITKLLDGKDITQEEERERCSECGRVMPR